MKFKNPQNGYIETVENCFILTLIMGQLYLAAKGAWKFMFISLFFLICTGGLAWAVIPFFAKNQIRKAYLRKGWIEIPTEKSL